MPTLEPFGSDARNRIVRYYAEDGHLVCPRCRNGHTVRGNYRDMCDLCCIQCLNAAGDFVTFKMLTQEESDELVRGIKEAQNRWRA